VAKHDWERWFRALLIFFASAALVIGLGAVAVIYFTVRDATEAANAMARLKVVLSYEILILTFFYGFMVLLYMAAGEIDTSPRCSVSRRAPTRRATSCTAQACRASSC
jgi:hypothetical protein